MDLSTLNLIIFSIVLIFSIAMGLSLGLSKLNKMKLLSFSIAFGLITMIFSFIFTYFKKTFFPIFNDYVYIIIFLIGLITLLSGISLLRKWREDKNKSFSVLSNTTIAILISTILGVISFSVLFDKDLNSKIFEIILISVAFVVITLFIALFTKYLRRTKTPYSVLTGNYMILTSLYLFMLSLILPYIESLSEVNLGPLNLKTSFALFFLVSISVGVLLLGVYLKREGYDV